MKSSTGLSFRLFYKTALILALIIQLTACNTSNDKVFVENEVADSIFADAKETDFAKKAETTESKNFPIENDMTLELLLEGGVFHEDEVKVDAATKDWFGIFETKEGYRLAETEIITSRANDVVLDETEEDRTGWEIETSIKDTCLILIEKNSSLSERKIPAVKVPETIYPKKKFKFTFSGITYTLFAEGNVEIEDSEVPIAFNYKMYLTAHSNGKDHTSLLVAQDKFDDQMTKIIFAGDIDGDGKLDLIIDTSYHYNMGRPTLYLSKAAEKDQIIKPVAMFTFVGC